MKSAVRLCALASFALALAALASDATAASPETRPGRASKVALRSQEIDVRRPPPVPSSLAAGAATALTPLGAESELVVVKYPAPVGASERRALAEAAERVLLYLPHDAYLVRVPRGTGQGFAPPGASWVGPYHPAYKISPEAAALAADPGLRPDEAPLPLMLHLDPGADLDAAVAGLHALGAGEVVGFKAKDRLSRVRLLMTPAEIAASVEPLARFGEVIWIELEGRRVLLNDTTAWVGQSGTAGGQATPVHDAGIFGQGQVIAVLDTGLDADMCYFHDPVEGLPATNECDGGTAVNVGHRKVLAVDFLWSVECAGGISISEWDTHGHGTHVAGTVAGDDDGDGVRDPGDGMAPAAKLVIQDGGLQFNNCADLPGIGCPVVDLNPVFQQTYDQGARFHSNSWGDRENFTPHNIYSAGSEDADEFMWNHKDFLLVFAAGNNGDPDSVVSPSTGKNVLSIGSTQRGSSAENLSFFSSCGLTDDDRIKPDFMVPGSGIQSANDDGDVDTFNCNVTGSSGTSMAAPGAAGFAALVRQYYQDGYYPSGAAVPADGFTPSAALTKATLLNSTEPMTGVPQPIPSACQGWGRVLLDNALELGAETRELWVEDDVAGFSTPGERTFYLGVDGAGEPLRATLTWTDFPSTPAAGLHLVNDLDLEVRGPGGLFLGNVFSGGVSTPGGSPDRRDTVEQVLLATPGLGVYSITVRAFNLPSGPQPFALVVSGDVTAPLFADGFETGDTSSWSASTP